MKSIISSRQASLITCLMITIVTKNMFVLLKLKCDHVIIEPRDYINSSRYVLGNYDCVLSYTLPSEAFNHYNILLTTRYFF